MSEEIFKKKLGSDILRKPLVLIVLFLFVIVTAKAMASKGLMIGIALVVLPAALIFLNRVFINPRLGLLAVFIVEFFVLGLGRYIQGFPLGLTVDGLLIITYLGLIFNNFYKKVDWTPANNLLTYLAMIWFGFALLQLVNPEAISRVAWFYAMRGVSLYMLLTVPLVFILWDKPKDIERFLILWAVFSILGTLKGIGQKMFGVDPWEQAWLDGGGAITHILFGKLRIFSFYTDAGQFGGAQGHAGVVFTILFITYNEKKDLLKRLLFLTAGLLGLYGMLISGTRGAIAAPIAGFFLYLILSKNIRVLTLGSIIGLSVIFILKFTLIGNQNADIRRMRSAFDPNDASLQTRLNNQQILKTYLRTRPFGGGIGSSGAWGQRFSPNGFLANVATDSWYVVIWAEQGIIGLFLHLTILFIIVGKSAYLIMFKLRDPILKGQMQALASGIFGIMGASYGNAVLGQMPTGIIVYISMSFLMMSPKFDELLLQKQEKAQLPESVK
ncbi:MAG: O-antigen ligase domain-containing protein [Bacteroidales bacterium]|nr:O-antigen ligase domain-containing protein [Bacteroidales bacterium]